MAGFDMIDLRILDVLQREGRLSAALVGELVGLSETASYNRLKRIEASGVIDHHCTKLFAKRVMPLQIFFTSVWLERDRAEDLQAFERAVSQVPEIIECHYITGSVDYLLKWVNRDFDSYSELMNSFRDQLPNIKRWETTTQVRQVKATEIPFERLERARRTDS